MSASAQPSTTGFRLFYDEVLESVRADLRGRLGVETINVADITREVGRLWKECPRQEEYRQKAAELRKSQPGGDTHAPAAAEDSIIPPNRIRRVLNLDKGAPRMTKDAVRTLSQATFYFISQLAGDVHNYIVDTESSYPVKPEHIWGMVNNPLYLKYRFLMWSEKQLTGPAATHTSAESAGTMDVMDGTADADLPSSGDEQPTEAAQEPPKPAPPTRKPATKKPAKKLSESILNYFGVNKAS
ncbi:40S ribosomal protein S13-1 [Babesia caballi]|uniref:40S ribosomal protein S13-1 n=1 Tax=Babesia caballi TaxID=5871 RepID=A0AAV4LW20_BABCB|nr:40S ribosomal protein S13-1 [Babesia caballi]